MQSKHVKENINCPTYTVLGTWEFFIAYNLPCVA